MHIFLHNTVLISDAFATEICKNVEGHYVADPNPATICFSWSDPYQHFLTDRLKNIASGMY